MTPATPKSTPPRDGHEAPPATAPVSEPAWVPCPECWGQRRIIEFQPARNGEGRIPVVTGCARCLGIGEVLR